MKGRYQKERFGKILFKRLIIPFLVAFIAHCVIYAVFLKFKIPYFRSNDSIAHVNLVEQLEYDPDYNQAFMLYYPGYDYGHSGIEKTALVLDGKTNEIIACDEFTLPDNKVLASYLEDSEKYKEDLEKVTETLNFPAKRGNLEDSSIFGMKYYNISTGKKVDGRNVTVFTVMRVNYYMYFFKYIFPVDLVLFFSALSASLVLTFRKEKIDFKDEYKRSVINSLSHDLKTPLTIMSGCAENLKENVDREKREFYEDAKNNKDKAFVMNFGQYKALGEYLKIPSYKALGPGGLSNIFPLGYWNAYLPGMLRQQERYNLQNPLKDFINPNVYMVECDKNMFLTAKTFYETNYNSQLNSEIVKRFGDIKVVKYTVKENEK